MLGEKLLIKLWDSIADKGIGGILTPWQTLRTEKAKTEAKARDIVAIAQAEKIADEIRAGKAKLIGYDDNIILIEAESIPIESTEEASQLNADNLIEYTKDQQKADLIRSEINIAKALSHAEERLSDDPSEPSSEKIEDDWLYRWKDYASKVSAEDLQQLWGAALAGETKMPGTYSLRTLEFLKNLSKEEAKLIEKCGTFAVSGAIISSESEILEAHGLNYSAFLKLQGLGIIHGAEAFGMSTEFPSMDEKVYKRGLVSNNLVLFVESDDPEKKVTLASYGISDLGKQIFSLGKFDGNRPYLMSIAQKIIKSGFQVKIGKWQPISGNKGEITELENVLSDEA